MQTPSRRRFLSQVGTVGAGSLLLPSLLSAEEAKTLKVLIFGGNLPKFEELLTKDYRANLLRGGADPKKKDAKEDNVTGLEQLADADLWIGSVHKRTYPSETQLAHFKKFHAAGKPIVGYRAASHVFENWLEIAREVFGLHYKGHHLLNKEKDLVLEYGEGAADHPIFKGIKLPPPLSGSYVYVDKADDVKVLLYCGLKGDMMPHTWVRENAKTKGRVFYTRYDAKELAEDPVVREIFLRGVLWALNRDMTSYRKKSE